LFAVVLFRSESTGCGAPEMDPSAAAQTFSPEDEQRHLCPRLSWQHRSGGDGELLLSPSKLQTYTQWQPV